MELRPYQQEAVSAILASFNSGNNFPAVVMPTGTGKTVTFTGLISAMPTTRFVVVAHREELIHQAARAISSATGEPVGIVMGRENNFAHRVTVASIATLASSGRDFFISRDDVLIVDECHHAAAESYRRVLSLVDRAVGFTATMSRSDGLRLGSVWTDIVYQRSVLWAIRNGFLCDVVGHSIYTPDLDLSSLRMSGSDYRMEDIARAVEASAMLPHIAIEAIREHAPDDPGVIFTPSVASAAHFAEVLSDAGFPTGYVHGGTSRAERSATLSALDSGELQFVANCAVLTEGFDSPRLSTCILARPTASPGLYTQMVGRVMRPHESKDIAKVLDLVSASTDKRLSVTVVLSGADPDEQEEKKESKTFLELFEEEPDDFGLPVPPLENIASEEIDLFDGSRHRWHTSDRGRKYLSLYDRAIVVIHDDGRWLVAEISVTNNTGRFISTDAATEDAAIRLAESLITETDETVAVADAPWRKKPATSKQRDHAKRLRIPYPEQELGKRGKMIPVRAGTLADMITRKSIGPKVDRIVTPI